MSGAAGFALSGFFFALFFATTRMDAAPGLAFDADDCVFPDQTIYSDADLVVKVVCTYPRDGFPSLLNVEVSSQREINVRGDAFHVFALPGSVTKITDPGVSRGSDGDLYLQLKGVRHNVSDKLRHVCDIVNGGISNQCEDTNLPGNQG